MPSAIAPGKWLVLVAPQTVIYGLSRMFHLWREEAAHYKIVRAVEEAYAWLGLEAPDFRAIEASVERVGGPSR
jgi:hypothetical protein